MRVDASRNLYFGWGRSGAINELQFGSNLSTSAWYGVYIGFNGTRDNNTTQSSIADIFDIRFVNLVTGSVGSSLSTSANWGSANSSYGARMDREFNGYMTIGGRASNRSFHGKIASFVSTTLRCGQAMPTTAEISEMVTDPMDWLTNYKVGNAYRRPSVTTDSNGFTMNTYDSASSTQVWLMGDGTADSYANMIRNAVYVVDQNRYKLNMISMVSGDIQNVNINGLT